MCSPVQTTVAVQLWDLVSEVDIIHEAPPGVDGEVLSDHWPVLVTFRTPNPTAQPGRKIASSVTECRAPLGRWGLMMSLTYFVCTVLS